MLSEAELLCVVIPSRNLVDGGVGAISRLAQWWGDDIHRQWRRGLHGLRGGAQHRVHLHQVHDRQQTCTQRHFPLKNPTVRKKNKISPKPLGCTEVDTCVVNLLSNVDPLPVCQSAIDWGSCSWSQRWVEGVDVETQVNRPLLPVARGENTHNQFTLQEIMWAFIENKTVSNYILGMHMQPRQEMVKSHFHDPLDAESVNVPHGEVLDAQVLQNVTEMTVKHLFSSKSWNIKLKPIVLLGGYKWRVFSWSGWSGQGVVNYRVIQCRTDKISMWLKTVRK